MKLKNILSGQVNNHILPFLWVHGESEEVYRETIQAIYHANIRAFCVEARPHEQFCRTKWWQDMEIILDEAERLGMKVWILDDKHFPTGYAAGAVEKAPAKLRRQNVLSKEIMAENGKISISLKEVCHQEPSFIQNITDIYYKNKTGRNTFQDDRFISAVAICTDEKREPILLNKFIKKDVLSWNVPKGRWKIVVCWLSRNTGTHRGYINMMDRESCRILIDQVYETHYAHFKDKFGTVIAGFFSDEPELGNGPMYKMQNVLGTDQDLPWSRELEKVLRKELGDDFRRYLPLLWNNDCNEKLTARVRYIFMDAVTRLVERFFSKQIGMWCREHGVEYIGHVVEDCNQHARTGTSLGHYFRGLKWQTMAGVDVIGGQIYPYEEDIDRDVIWDQPGDAEFYHYSLSKLGSSLGELNPNMKNRTMCEIFGNYSWSEGTQLEKYLLDHCMVRGINYFVPHAFSCKEYPDPDCPPHFHAHGHDPLYRHFAELMSYTNRVTSLMEGGASEAPAAILYHGEAEWTGKCMLMQKPARILQDHQMDFRFVPCDVFEEAKFYQTEIGKTLVINGKEHKVLIIPYAQFIPEKTVEVIVTLEQNGFPVIFLEALPEGTCQGGELPKELEKCKVLELCQLKEFMESADLRTTILEPENQRVRAMHYQGDEEFLYLFNESDTGYQGTVCVPWEGETVCYNAWKNRLEKFEQTGKYVKVCMQPSESCILVCCEEILEYEKVMPIYRRTESLIYRKKLTGFNVSTCRSIDYPNFKFYGQVESPEDFSKVEPEFSGYIRYDTTFELEHTENVVLEITKAYEAVEVFVNGKSAGIEILPPFRFDISGLCQEGNNELRIEVATTLERENNGAENALPTGITGDVYLIF